MNLDENRSLDAPLPPLPPEITAACIRYVRAHCDQPGDVLEALGVAQ